MTPADLAFYTAAGKWEAEPGAFKVFVGGNSRDGISLTYCMEGGRRLANAVQAHLKA